MLLQIIPYIKPHEVHWMLAKCKDDAGKDIEQVLAQSTDKTSVEYEGSMDFIGVMPHMKKNGRNARRRRRTQ